MVTQKAGVPSGWSTPIGDYRLHLLGIGRSVATVRLRVDWVRRFARAVEVGPWEVGTADVIEWSAGHLWARDTRRSALQSVAGFYAWASEAREVGVDPARTPVMCRRSGSGGSWVGRYPPGSLCTHCDIVSLLERMRGPAILSLCNGSWVMSRRKRPLGISPLLMRP